MAVGKNITWKKGKGKQYHLPIILRLLGRISNGEEDGNIGELFKNMGMGKNIKLKGILYTPEFFSNLATCGGDRLVQLWKVKENTIVQLEISPLKGLFILRSSSI